ncbi:MAG: Holliday junction branch migration protein RuvA [Patescibacteria group bacterium]|nr:Holliday junction branch migration protein RuvA [Patescibacteria group bacterium]
MIAFLKGKIIIKKEKFVVLDVNGVGYKVFLSKKTLSKLPEINENIKFFCSSIVRENSISIYGFLDYEEFEFFETLEKISGVGPKAALEISCLGPLRKIQEKILEQDEKIFQEIPGIGRKKAMTIILELSGKIKELKVKKSSNEDEALSALIALGFPQKIAKQALSGISKDLKTSEERIKESLKILGQKPK